MSYLLTALAYLVSLTLMAIIASFGVLYLVGPHGGPLPQSFYIPVLIVGWAGVIVVPVLFTRWFWRRLTTR